MKEKEGKGIEIYDERKNEKWKWKGDRVKMRKDMIDVWNMIGVIKSEGGEWEGEKKNKMIGKVKMSVGNEKEDEKLWKKEMGFEKVKKYGEREVLM